MLPEISLNILDIAQNSIKAEASLLEIIVETDADNFLHLTIKDDGWGMTPEELSHVCDPFYTSRTTRKVGLGVPFVKQEAESTGGTFSIESAKNIGTTLTATFNQNSIDCMPLGDIASTIHLLVIGNENIDIVFDYQVRDNGFTLDTRQFREILGDGVSFQLPEVSAYIKDFLVEGIAEVNNAG